MVILLWAMAWKFSLTIIFLGLFWELFQVLRQAKKEHKDTVEFTEVKKVTPELVDDKNSYLITQDTEEKDPQEVA